MQFNSIDFTNKNQAVPTYTVIVLKLTKIP